MIDDFIDIDEDPITSHHDTSYDTIVGKLYHSIDEVAIGADVLLCTMLRTIVIYGMYKYQNKITVYSFTYSMRILMFIIQICTYLVAIWYCII
jgi:hypothetical protein